MATYVWFVPGFMGSALAAFQQQPGVAPPGRKMYDLWGTYAGAVNIAHIRELALPGNLQPGWSVQPTGLVSVAGEGYEQFSLYVVRNMPGGFVYSPWAYDWRQSARDLGRALASQLEANQGKGNQNIVVAHSQGALVAWAAWAALVDDGQQAAMNRLITFAGALYGTTSTPQVFQENESGLDALTLLLHLLSGRAFLSVTPAGDAALRASQVQTLSIAATWPSLYDLYADVSMLDDPADTNRGLLFNPTAWNPALVDPNFPLLQTEVTRVHQWLRQAKYAMPAGQVAHIVGRGTHTPWRVQPAAMTAQEANRYAALARPAPNARQVRQLQLPGLTTTTDGDGRCTTAQQMFPGGYVQYVASQHAAMQFDPAVQQLVVRLLDMPIPTRPLTPVLQQETVWHPPPPPGLLPQFEFDNAPIKTAQPVKVPFKEQIAEGLPALQ